MKISQPVFKMTGEKPSDWKKELVYCPEGKPFYWVMESACSPFPVKCIGEDLTMRQKIYVRTDVYPFAWLLWLTVIRIEKSWTLLNQFLILLLEAWGLAIAQPGEQISWAWVMRKIKGGDRNE